MTYEGRVMNEMEMIAVTRSSQEFGWVAEKTPSGTPMSTARPRATHARTSVWGRLFLI